MGIHSRIQRQPSWIPGAIFRSQEINAAAAELFSSSTAFIALDVGVAAE